MGPVMSLWIGFIMPAALSIYWIAQGVFSSLQEVVLTKLFRKGFDEEDAAKQEAALARAMEEAEKDVMERPPRDRKESIFADGLGFDIAFQGLIIAAITVFSYFAGHRMESGAWAIAESPAGMTMAFLTLSMIEIFHSFNMRSRNRSLFSLKKQNLWLWGTLAFSLLVTAAVIFVPFLNRAFSFQPISITEYLVAMALALAVIPIVEIEKAFRRRVQKKHQNQQAEE